MYFLNLHSHGIPFFVKTSVTLLFFINYYCEMLFHSFSKNMQCMSVISFSGWLWHWADTIAPHMKLLSKPLEFLVMLLP